jgi:hypothetical protein
MNDKIKKNEWLLNKNNFITNSNFDDKYYLETLGRYIANFLKESPVSCVTYYNKYHKSIYIMIGDNKKEFKLSNDINYKDFLTLVKKWLINFFPTYEVELEKEENYSSEEIIKIKNNSNSSILDILYQKKKIIYTEKGIIEKFRLKEDEFILNRNNVLELYTTALKDKPLPISEFMKDIRCLSIQIKNNIELNRQVYQYIFNNSKKIKDIDIYNNNIFINYKGTMLLNFFKINYDSLKKFDLEEINKYNYRWGNYYIKFDSNSLKNDCLDIYNKFKLGFEINDPFSITS